MKRWKAIVGALLMCGGLTVGAWAQPQGWLHQDGQKSYDRDAQRGRDRQNRDRRGDRDDQDRDHRSNRYYGWDTIRRDGDRDDNNPGRHRNYDYDNSGWVGQWR